MKSQKLHTTLSLILVFVAGMFFASCDKEKDSIGVVKVVDPAGDPVNGANVRAYGEPSDTLYSSKEVRVDKEDKTGADGKVKFKFNDYYKKGQAGLVVLDIEAEKDSLSGEGYIEIKEGEEKSKTVTIE